jgi:thiol-disulfide isomerase/thioredoxin
LTGCLSAFGGEKIASVGGTYKDALRKAGEAGKPVMLEFWRDGLVDCQRQWAQMEEISETVNRFVYYRVNGPKNKPLAQQFDVTDYPTLIFLKLDGSEIYRQHGIHTRAGQLRGTLEKVLREAGPIAKAQKPKTIPKEQKTSSEITAMNELKSAQSYLDVGRTNEAVRVWKSVVSRYPGTEAAEMAQERLDKLEGNAAEQRR